MIEAVPLATWPTALIAVDQCNQSGHLVESFSMAVGQHIRRWRELLQGWHAQNKRVVLWGGGSKAVAFLATLQCSSQVDLVVDINPYKQGMYLPGSGHRVIAPESLGKAQMDIILVMNPVYMEEIRNQVTSQDLKCELLPLLNKRSSIAGE